MNSAVPLRSTTHRVLALFTVVLVVLLLYLTAWDGLTATAFRKLGPGFFIRIALHHTDGNAQLAMVDRRNRNSSSSNTVADSNNTSYNTREIWFQHPAVFTLQQLGLWQTSFLGVVDPTMAAPQYTGQAGNRTKGTSQQHKEPNATDAVLLQHWWRCQGTGAEKLQLRGVGSAYSAVDSSFLMQLLPGHVDDEWSALNLTQTGSNTTWRMQQSKLQRGGINAWHVEAADLPAASSYSITTSSSLSKHSYSWDATRCTSTPAMFRAGGMWTVITQAKEYDPKLYAGLLRQHTSYHQAIGFTGSILFVTRPTAAALVQQQIIREGMDDGSIVIVLWGYDTVPSMPYYYQYLWYNLVILATWGVPDIKLAMMDLDEFLVVPQHLTLTAAFQPGSCLHGYQQVRIARLNAYFGLTAAQAAACHKAASQVPSPAQKAAGLTNLGFGVAEIERVLINITTSSCYPNNTSINAASVMSAAAARNDGSLLDACESLKQHLKPDIIGLTNLGWQQYFQQQQQQQQQQPQQQQRPCGQESGAGYVDQHTTTAPSVRWAHKSVVDPNHVAAYAVHEASVILPGGQDTRNAVPYSCAFGIHLVNMFRHRWLGSGQQLQLILEKGGAFNLAGHVQLLLQHQATAALHASDVAGTVIKTTG